MCETGCYACAHQPVCKHFNKWSESFPYTDDSKIGPYLDGIAKTLSAACAFFAPKDNQKG